jgi:hypothetical protein
MPPAADPGWLVGPVPPGRRAEAGRRAATLTPTERDSCQKEGPLHCSWHKTMTFMNKVKKASPLFALRTCDARV